MTVQNHGNDIPIYVTKINILSPISRCQHNCSLILTGGKILIFEIQSELVKSSKLDLNFGSNLTKSLKSREDFRNKGFIMFRNSPVFDYPESGQKLIMSRISRFCQGNHDQQFGSTRPADKRGCVFPMVIWLKFRMGQYRVNDHPYHASQFTNYNMAFRILISLIKVIFC